MARWCHVDERVQHDRQLILIERLRVPHRQAGVHRGAFLPDPGNAQFCACDQAPHFHMLYLNGVYAANGYFWPVKSPAREELDVMTHTIATRIAHYLEKAAYLIKFPLTTLEQRLWSEPREQATPSRLDIRLPSWL